MATWRPFQSQALLSSQRYGRRIAETRRQEERLSELRLPASRYAFPSWPQWRRRVEALSALVALLLCLRVSGVNLRSSEMFSNAEYPHKDTRIYIYIIIFKKLICNTE